LSKKLEETVAQIKVKWIGKGQFVGTDGTKRSLVMSTQDEENGIGLKPSDLLLVSLGGCTGIDLVSILSKRRQNLTGLEINITAEQDPNPPWTFRKLHLEYILHGKGLSNHGVERAIKLSEEKYCPVSATISEVAELTSSFRIIENEA
jgi:putative redox protein